MISSARLRAVKDEESSDPVTEMQVAQRRGAPEHFLLKVESFSESILEKYESDEFDAGGYKWKLILYPNGDKEKNASNCISLYLSICDTQNLPSGWEVEADFSLFLYNTVSQNYLTYKNKTWFNWLKTESGFTQLMPLDEFKETSNGYLFGDACVFGAEVYVTKSSGIAKTQTLSMMKKNNIFTWTVENFSKLKGTCLQSEDFMIGDVQWNLQIYPKGIDGDSEDKSISFFLAVADYYDVTKLVEGSTVIAEYTLRIRNQLNSNHVEQRGKGAFVSGNSEWGFSDFMQLSDVKDSSKGFMKNDSLVVEAELTNVEVIKNSNQRI